MDDDYGTHTSFDSQYRFLHEKYFPRIAWSGLKLNPAKSHFWSKDLKLLGFAGSGQGGLRPSIDKIAAIRDYPVPSDVAGLERFLHISTYLRQWVPGRSDHAKILKTAILCKINSMGARRDLVLHWKAEHDSSFKYIKDCIANNVIWGGDPTMQYHLSTDASNLGLGAVLFQLDGLPLSTVAGPKFRENERIILFISKAFAPAETRYHTTEREALAVVRALSEVRWLVLGSPHPIKVYTDHQALLSVLKGDEAKGRIARWQMQLAEYDMEIHHVPGSQNVIADGMSRLSTRWEGECKEMEVSAVEIEGWKDLVEDEWYGVMVEYKLTGMLPASKIAGKAGKEDLSETDKARWLRRLKHQSARFVIVDPETSGRPHGLLYREKNGETAICIKKRNIKEILSWAHDVHRHFAESITLKKLIGKYYWSTRHRDTSYSCRSCDSCQRVGPLRPSQALLPIFQLQPMDLWGMDFIGPIAPISRSGNRYILIVVDYFTRYLFTSTVARADSAAVVALISEIGKYIGWPRAIYNDNGSHFVNASVKQLLERRGVKQFPAPKSHPQSVGLAERYVQLVVVGLRTLMATSLPNRYIWDEMLPGVTHAINTRVIRAHGYTPSQLLFEFNLRRTWLDATPRDQLASAVISDAIVEIVGRHEVNREMMGDNLGEAADAAELTELWTYHQRLSKVEEIREAVRTKALERFEIDRQHGRKFEAKWEGPYKLDKIAWHGRTGRVFDLITGEEARVKKTGLHERVHLDDLKVFVPREDHWLGFEEDRQERGNLRFVGLCEVLGKDEEEGVREWGDRTVIFPGGMNRVAEEE
ncbi:uncharacterized protein H6S33_002856 [Morchella sextelata]|uniref:uncharacterized protein n=1 Tax=Morchella sextelata TaxID=1174677 RepID=UPI001D044E50|nr:uncharacterized protein H6S33_002856 [Morchella sextelata]KAH0607822.1 hypothetical protein H6S33_002856 [Morchella sextelata]